MTGSPGRGSTFGCDVVASVPMASSGVSVFSPASAASRAEPGAAPSRFGASEIMRGELLVPDVAASVRPEHGVDDFAAVEDDEVVHAARSSRSRSCRADTCGRRRCAWTAARPSLATTCARVMPGSIVGGDPDPRAGDAATATSKDERDHVQFPHAVTRASIDSKTPSPSADPSSGSTARSGCGIMPSTLPASLTMPAMARMEPLGLHHSSASPGPPT